MAEEGEGDAGRAEVAVEAAGGEEGGEEEAEEGEVGRLRGGGIPRGEHRSWRP